MTALGLLFFDAMPILEPSHPIILSELLELKSS